MHPPLSIIHTFNENINAFLVQAFSLSLDGIIAQKKE
jgi:hypothetical protein